MKFLLIFGIVLILLIFLYLFLSMPAFRGSGLLNRLSRRSYAHRGLHDIDAGIPENSMAAFRRALDNGFGFELDVRLTRDGKLVVMHDNNTKRVAGIGRIVSESTYEDLQRLHLGGTGEKIPLFSDVLSLVNGRQAMIVEVKTEKNCDQVCSAVAKLLDRYKGDFVVESFDPMAVRWFKKNRPKYIRGQLVTRFSREGRRKPLMDIIESLLLFNVLGRPDFIAVNVKDVNVPGVWLNRVLYGAREFRWTVKTLKDYRAAAEKKSGIIFEDFIPEE